MESEAILSVEDFVSDLINSPGLSVEGVVNFVNIVNTKLQQLLPEGVTLLVKLPECIIQIIYILCWSVSMEGRHRTTVVHAKLR